MSVDLPTFGRPTIASDRQILRVELFFRLFVFFAFQRFAVLLGPVSGVGLFLGQLDVFRFSGTNGTSTCSISWVTPRPWEAAIANTSPGRASRNRRRRYPDPTRRSCWPREGRLLAAAQVLGDALIRRHQAGAGVDHEQHDVRFFDRQQRLTGHARFNAVFGAIDTAGIDDDNSLPSISARPYLRSRVSPGKSATSASRVWVKRLNKVDLPTFGRPTSATTGIIVEASLLNNQCVTALWIDTSGAAYKIRNGP